MAAALGVVGAVTGCSAAQEEETAADEGSVTGVYNDWREQRAARAANLAKYLAANAEDFAWFKNAPLGSSGIPVVMFRLFPELFPEIFGEDFVNVGLGKDVFEPSRVMPLGMGYGPSEPPVQTPAGPVNIQVAALTCYGCHGGQVKVGPVTLPIIGAPNTRFNQFRLAVARTVNSPGYTADRFRAALAAKPMGWLYGDPAMAQQEALERGIFMQGAESMMATLKARANAGAARFAATLGAHTYAVPNAPDLYGPKPGYLDAIGAGITIIVDPAKFTSEQLRSILPPAPAEIDIMSVWNQKDRPAAQWDGSIQNALIRNLAAEFGVIGDPTKLNMENAVRTTRFTTNLPSTPYPFDVDRGAMARGKILFQQNCASCHAPGNATVYPLSVVGTDANRANIWTPYTVAGLTQMLRIGCTDPACEGIPDDQIARATGGYMAVPLDGIWARAPYLHNGSVPTLYHLLTGERPATFYRGNVAYDQEKVGFVWDKAEPGAALFDTSKSGLSNTGHSFGIDWKREPKKLRDLLEYLKTL